jgi:N-acyl homoserine lactone hydrolase
VTQNCSALLRSGIVYDIMGLRELPPIDRLRLAELVLPEFHPESANDPVSPVFAYLVHHPDGPVLVDTGVGRGNEFLDQVYQPTVTDLDEALARVGVDARGVVAIVNSHLHFDHCGQNAMFYGLPVPVYVQGAELEAARQPFYTDPAWANVPPDQLRRLEGDETLLEGIRIVASPGHTAGHQSVIVEGGGERAVIAAQSAWRVSEFETGNPSAGNVSEDLWDVGVESLRRLRSLDPTIAYFSHDEKIYRRM